jgi:general secretion pathway protein N
VIAAAQRQRLPTLLLGAFALWSLLVTICVYAGLGGRYSLHPDDPSQVPPLPAVDLSRAQNPLGPLPDYAVVGERPLFNADRRPLPPPESAAAPADAAPPPVPLDVVLTSVVISGDIRIAIVQDKKTNKSQSVKVGNALAGEQANWKLIELGPRKAVFEGPTGRSEAELRVFDGSGGEAPTAAAPPEAVVSGDPASAANAAAAAAAIAAGQQQQQENPQTPEARAELIRKRIEERRRQMREEAERANKQSGG